jgi:hypothetical protein
MADPVPVVVWVDVADVEAALGQLPATANDVAFLEQSVAAANVVAWRRRVAAGYVDDPVVVPDSAVAAGVVKYAVALYRSRGAVDGFPSFEESTGFVPTGGAWGDILKLWGVPRMGVG